MFIPIHTKSKVFLVALILIGSFYAFQKLAIPIGGKNKVQFALFMMYALVLYLILINKAKIHGLRLILIFICTMMGCITIIVGDINYVKDSSLASFMLFIIIYLPCAFVVPIDRSGFDNILRAYVILGLIAAGLVAFNWVTQVAKMGLPLNLDKIIPETAIFREYVYIQPTSWKSIWMKPNAVFFLETSVLSQFIASTLIIEFCFFRRFVNISVLSVAILATFGGTGLLLIVLIIPLVAYYVNFSLVLASILGAPAILGVAYGIGLLDNIIHRSGDFERQGSSADDRFIKQIRILGDFFSQDIYYVFFGHGPGSLSVDAVSKYFIPIVKSLYEYGIIFSIFYIFLTILICFGRGVPVVIGFMGLITIHFLNAAFLVPIFIYIPLLMGGGYWLEREENERLFSGRRPNPKKTSARTLPLRLQMQVTAGAPERPEE